MKYETITIRNAVFRELKMLIKNDKKISAMMQDTKFVNFFRYVEIRFHKMFTFEIYSLLEVIINSDKRYYNVDKTELRKEADRLKESTYLQSLDEDAEMDISPLYNLFVFKPLEMQLGVFNDYKKLVINASFRGLILDATVGSGKTYMSLALAELSEQSIIVIVAPKETLVDVWEDSIEKSLYKRNRRAWLSSSGQDYNGERYIVCHYEYLDKFMKIAKKLKDIFLIVDEVQNFASPNSNRTKLLNELYKTSDVKKSILMSGTPVTSKFTELINLIRYVDPYIISDREFEKFKKVYKAPNALFREIMRNRFIGSLTRITSDMVKKVPLEHIRLDVEVPDSDKYLLVNIREAAKEYAKARIEYFTYNKDMYEALYVNLYTKVKDNIISKHISDFNFKQYESDVKTIVAMYKRNRLRDILDIIKRTNSFENRLISHMDSKDKKDFREAKTVYKYLALKIQGEVLANVIGKARESAHIDMARILDIESLIHDSDSKTVIFSKYVKVCDAVKDKLTGYKLGLAYGKDTKNIARTLKEFAHDREVNPIIATYKSLSTGVRLTSASTTLFIDLPFTASELEQAIARTWRLGQELPTTFYYVYLDTGGEENINSRNIDIVSVSSEIVEKLTGVSIGSMETKKKEIEIEIEHRFSSIFSIDKFGFIKSIRDI